MNKGELLIGLIVIGLIAGVGWYAYTNWYQVKVQEEAYLENQEIVTEEGSDVLIEAQVEDVQDITEQFVTLYTTAIKDRDEAVAQEARMLLSERAHTVVDRDQTVIAGLQRLTRNLTPPAGIDFNTTRKQSDGFAEVAVSWQTDTEPLTRYFYLIIDPEGNWKIDSIQTVQQ